MKIDLARANRIPGDWGLEVGVLAEIFRNCAIKRICQVAICENYEHKHQSLSPDDQLQLEWLSDAELRAWHPGFDPKFGPASASYKADNPVKIIFVPAK